MKVLLVHHSMLPDSFIPMGLSVLSAVLKKTGHRVDVFDTFYYHHKDKLEALSPLFKRVKKYKPREDLFRTYKRRLKNFRPDVVGFTATENEMPMIKNLIRLTDAYIVLGGAYPTSVPEETIKIPRVNAVCVGEGEEALTELLECLENCREPGKIRNMWIKKKDEIQKNPLRPLIDINKLPFMDYSIIRKEMFVKPFMGKNYRQAHIEMTRGCPYRCSYCINSYLYKLYKGLGPRLRVKRAERMIDELVYLRDNYNLEFIRFGDEYFLGQPLDNLGRFARLYNKKVKLPFIIATRPETITEERMHILESMPCKQVSLGIEHGNENFRKRVLHRYCSNERILDAFSLLRKHKIRSGAYLMMGFPFETEELVKEGFDFIIKVMPDIAAVYFFRPYEKTPLMDMCREHNLLKGISANYFDGSMVRGISLERLRKLRRDFYERFGSLTQSQNPA